MKTVRIPVLMPLCALSWLIIATLTGIGFFLIPFWFCMIITIAQILVANGQ